MGDLPLRTPTHRRLGGPSPRQQANAPHAHPPPERTFHPSPMRDRGVRGIRPRFRGLSPCGGQVAYVLLTSAPVAARRVATPAMPLDLHVLSLSLAFILSQDQTLRCCILVFFSLSIRKLCRAIPAKVLRPRPVSELFSCTCYLKESFLTGAAVLKTAPHSLSCSFVLRLLLQSMSMIVAQCASFLAQKRCKITTIF